MSTIGTLRDSCQRFGARQVDTHTHPYRLADLLAKDSEGFDTRITFMGES